MTVIAMIQARMGSTRLPGKVMEDICGKPMLQRVVERAELADIDYAVIVTSMMAGDDPIADLADELDIPVVRGQENDVLGRFMLAAEECKAQHDTKILRLTADCPLVDPYVINSLIANLKVGVDYVSNVRPRRTYPRGLDAELFWVDTLCRLDRLSTTDKAREHVTWMIQEQPTLWRTTCGQDIENNADLRWCVDTSTDLKVVRRLYESGVDDYRSMIAYARSHPECTANADVEQKDA